MAGYIYTTLQIGRPGAHSTIHYNDQDFERVAALLARLGDPAPQLEPTPMTPRAAVTTSSKKGTDIERSLSRALSRVAVLPFDMGIELPEGTDHLTMSWEAAARLPFKLILLCETLSCLSRLHEYQWIRARTRGRQTLALYSGKAGGIYRAEAVRRLLETSLAPVVAFVPFDPSGLAKAHATPRLEALALPDLTVLEKLAAYCTYDGDFVHQLRRHRGELDSTDHPQIASLWTVMKKLGNGVAISSFGLVAQGQPPY